MRESEFRLNINDSEEIRFYFTMLYGERQKVFAADHRNHLLSDLNLHGYALTRCHGNPSAIYYEARILPGEDAQVVPLPLKAKSADKVPEIARVSFTINNLIIGDHSTYLAIMMTYQKEMQRYQRRKTNTDRFLREKRREIRELERRLTEEEIELRTTNQWDAVANRYTAEYVRLRDVRDPPKPDIDEIIVRKLAEHRLFSSSL